MWQGNSGNTVQAAEEKVSAYSDNICLIETVQSSDEYSSERALERLIELNRGLIKNIAYKFSERGVDMEDLLQLGTIGMIKAARSFDIDRGVCFSTYAVPLIFGEIRRHLRDEGAIKVGRYQKKLGAALLNERNRIMAEEGREAGIRELAALCAVSPEEAAMAMDAVSPIISLSDSAYSEDEGVELSDTIADEESLSENQRFFERIALGEAISKMPDMWKKIVSLRFYRDKTQQQTADILGLTQVKVSREEKKIFEFLRGEMM